MFIERILLSFFLLILFRKVFTPVASGVFFCLFVFHRDQVIVIIFSHLEHSLDCQLLFKKMASCLDCCKFIQGFPVLPIIFQVYFTRTQLIMPMNVRFSLAGKGKVIHRIVHLWIIYILLFATWRLGNPCLLSMSKDITFFNLKDSLLLR